MGEPTSLLLAWLGLIWVALLILRRKLSGKHERFITFLTYLMAWAILLDFFFRDFPVPLNIYASYVTCGSFVIFLIWLYLGESISKHTRIPRVPRFLESENVTLVFACMSEAMCVIDLYGAGYVAGGYDTLAPIAEIVHMRIANVYPALYFGIIFYSFGIAFSTIAIACVLYSRGLRGAKIGVLSKLL